MASRQRESRESWLPPRGVRQWAGDAEVSRVTAGELEIQFPFKRSSSTHFIDAAERFQSTVLDLKYAAMQPEAAGKATNPQRRTLGADCQARKQTVARIKLQRAFRRGKQLLAGLAGSVDAVTGVGGSTDPIIVHGIRQLSQGSLLEPAFPGESERRGAEVHVPISLMLSTKKLTAQIGELCLAVVQFEVCGDTGRSQTTEHRSLGRDLS